MIISITLRIYLHFDIEQDIRTSFKYYEESGYKDDLDLLHCLPQLSVWYYLELRSATTI